ncbi:bifunctional demethylmenaquinone methyltransferase/2-methoxy-6-polyprenyl-1,4-benzoquinol methylase UbiE [Granulicella sibirica]|uniref:Demethylmenaquinone methyltransferase n=1 Tax=Granulicella sibirica TaxID=2479048 RepID=A0A4Q0SYA2_9BACT|nr:bifunctional demethylmenaquinone methyltransferase/2-methoxy-6-polyprenyl-1,4-benzoquinol methylase UbiE [Granulicella sibirica]RXH56203.1 2-heptaprenyl-1,4-naphthoquinone methyltransferase [Granulicella sibirica]
MPPETISTPHTQVTGARPQGTSDEQAAAQNVQRMFDTIAPSYDRLNHILSMGLDRTWWSRAAKVFTPVLARPEANILDLCCGTGDMTSALLALRPAQATPVTGLDFSHEMLDRARIKHAASNALFVQADALHLPYPDQTFDLITSAFGFRNLANYAEGLAELHRVLRPGGQIGILECNQPEGIVGAGYSLYFKKILPKLGGLISGNPAAYAYLPASVERFPRPLRMKQLITEAGYINAQWTGYTLGTAGLYQATKP